MLLGNRPTDPDTSYRLRMKFPVDIGGRAELEFEATSRWCNQNNRSDYFESGLQLDSNGEKQTSILGQLASEPMFEARESLSIKRLFDITLSSLGLLFSLPVFLLIGIAIRIDSGGSVFYGAERVGKFGSRFRMYKFRTMTESPGSIGPRVTAYDDPRVTRLGRLLRKTKLNELPQLLNVLKGEMTLVGPRPEYVEFVEHYPPEQREVLSVKPGITSLASIAFVNEEDMLQFSDVSETYIRNIIPDKLRLDLLYVRNQSLLLDIDVLLQTAAVLIPRFRRAAPQVEEIGVAPVRLARQHLPWFVVDALVAFISVGLAAVLWRSADLQWVDPSRSLIAALVITALFSLTNWLTGVQRIYWRYASPAEAINVIFSATAATAIVLIANHFAPPPGLPAQMLILTSLLTAMGFLISRYHRQLLKGSERSVKKLLSSPKSGRERVLVVGAGDAGQHTISLMQNNPSGRSFHVVGVVDDDLGLIGTLVHGVPVLGDCERIPEIVREKKIHTIVFAIHSIEESLRDHFLGLCQQTDARTVILPDLLRGLRESGTGLEKAKNALGSMPNSSRKRVVRDTSDSELHSQLSALVDRVRNDHDVDLAREVDKLKQLLQDVDSSSTEDRTH